MNVWTDSQTTGVTLQQVQADFPDLHCRKGAGGIYFAWRRDNPMGAPVAEGEDPRDLRDDIIRAEWRDSAAAAASGRTGRAAAAARAVRP